MFIVMCIIVMDVHRTMDVQRDVDIYSVMDFRFISVGAGRPFLLSISKGTRARRARRHEGKEARGPKVYSFQKNRSTQKYSVSICCRASGIGGPILAQTRTREGRSQRPTSGEGELQ